MTDILAQIDSTIDAGEQISDQMIRDRARENGVDRIPETPSEVVQLLFDGEPLVGPRPPVKQSSVHHSADADIRYINIGRDQETKALFAEFTMRRHLDPERFEDVLSTLPYEHRLSRITEVFDHVNDFAKTRGIREEMGPVRWARFAKQMESVARRSLVPKLGDEIRLPGMEIIASDDGTWTARRVPGGHAWNIRL